MAFVRCVAVLAWSLGMACTSGSGSLPRCDCPQGTVCDVAGDCVTCTPTDTCTTRTDCTKGAVCLSLIDTCNCVGNDGFVEDGSSDQFIGDPQNTIDDGNPALDLDAVVVSCSAGSLRTAMRMAAPVVRTTQNFISYAILITSGTDGAPPGGLLGNGVRQLSMEGQAGACPACFEPTLMEHGRSNHYPPVPFVKRTLCS